MKNTDKPVAEYDDDRFPLERLEANAILHYPNPSRRGCPSRDVLKRFVESPHGVTVGDLNDLHVFQCAECTLDLRHFREGRDARIARQSAQQQSHVMWRWLAIAAVLIVGVALPASYFIHRHNARSGSESTASLVLGDEQVERGPETGIVVPRAKITLKLELPQTAPPGSYDIVFSRRRSMSDPMFRLQRECQGTGMRPGLTAELDLRTVQEGGYWIGVQSKANGKAWYTYVSVE
ncbi:MAG: hypothetical protein JWM43_3167 [Acidobacteriaceae bacterium]|nr:hypothetical protein [Acidobacteriaceae bacterium]